MKDKRLEKIFADLDRRCRMVRFYKTPRIDGIGGQFENKWRRYKTSTGLRTRQWVKFRKALGKRLRAKEKAEEAAHGIVGRKGSK